jgi:two-component system KDP operon response regulator KdpE
VTETIALLDAGADDYVTKPFSPGERGARVRSLRRRVADAPARSADLVLRVGDLVIDVRARALTQRGTTIRLTPTEWDVLHTLASEPGRTVTHRSLFTAVWGSGAPGNAQQHLRVHVANLRRKIEHDPVRPRYILTEPGVGYRFTAP